MLFSDAVFNIFAGVFDILNDVRQNVAVVLIFLYSIFPNLDAIIRVSNYVRLNPGLQRARPLWSGASDKLIMTILPAQRKFMLLSLAIA